MAQVQRLTISDQKRFRFASPHGLLYALGISAILWAALGLLLAALI